MLLQAHFSSLGTLGMAALLLAGCTVRPAGADPAVPFQVLSRGVQSGVAHRQFIVIRDAAAFANWWQRATARQLPAPPQPVVDFSRSMVLAVFLGQRRSGGYRIEVADIGRDAKGLTVHVRTLAPGAGCMTTQALTQPYEMVETAATPAPVRFETQEIARRC